MTGAYGQTEEDCKRDEETCYWELMEQQEEEGSAPETANRLVPCAWCGRKHEQDWIKDDWIDKEDYIEYIKKYSKYPHVIVGDEVHIYFPICLECKEEFGL